MNLDFELDKVSKFDLWLLLILRDAKAFLLIVLSFVFFYSNPRKPKTADALGYDSVHAKQCRYTYILSRHEKSYNISSQAKVLCRFTGKKV